MGLVDEALCGVSSCQNQFYVRVFVSEEFQNHLFRDDAFLLNGGDAVEDDNVIVAGTCRLTGPFKGITETGGVSCLVIGEVFYSRMIDDQLRLEDEGEHGRAIHLLVRFKAGYEDPKPLSDGSQAQTDRCEIKMLRSCRIDLDKALFQHMGVFLRVSLCIWASNKLKIY